MAAFATSSIPVVANELTHIVACAAPAPRAVATSPSGCVILWYAVGARRIGYSRRCPKSVADVSSLADVAQDLGLQPDGVEVRPVVPQGDFVACVAGDVLVGHRRQSLPRELFVVEHVDREGSSGRTAVPWLLKGYGGDPPIGIAARAASDSSSSRRVGIGRDSTLSGVVNFAVRSTTPKAL